MPKPSKFYHAFTVYLYKEERTAYEKLREHLIKRRVKIQKRIENKTLLSQNIATLKALTEIDRILK